jgi:hypothetical protein
MDEFKRGESCHSSNTWQWLADNTGWPSAAENAGKHGCRQGPQGTHYAAKPTDPISRK